MTKIRIRCKTLPFPIMFFALVEVSAESVAKVRTKHIKNKHCHLSNHVILLPNIGAKSEFQKSDINSDRGQG